MPDPLTKAVEGTQALIDVSLLVDEVFPPLNRQICLPYVRDHPVRVLDVGLQVDQRAHILDVRLLVDDVHHVLDVLPYIPYGVVVLL